MVENALLWGFPDDPHSDNSEDDEGLQVGIQPDAARAEFLQKHAVRANREGILRQAGMAGAPKTKATRQSKRLKEASGQPTTSHAWAPPQHEQAAQQPHAPAPTGHGPHGTEGVPMLAIPPLPAQAIFPDREPESPSNLAQEAQEIQHLLELVIEPGAGPTSGARSDHPNSDCPLPPYNQHNQRPRHPAPGPSSSHQQLHQHQHHQHQLHPGSAQGASYFPAAFEQDFSQGATHTQHHLPSQPHPPPAHTLHHTLSQPHPPAIPSHHYHLYHQKQQQQQQQHHHHHQQQQPHHHHQQQRAQQRQQHDPLQQLLSAGPRPQNAGPSTSTLQTLGAAHDVGGSSRRGASSPPWASYMLQHQQNQQRAHPQLRGRTGLSQAVTPQRGAPAPTLAAAGGAGAPSSQPVCAAAAAAAAGAGAGATPVGASAGAARIVGASGTNSARATHALPASLERAGSPPDLGAPGGSQGLHGGGGLSQLLGAASTWAPKAPAAVRARDRKAAKLLSGSTLYEIAEGSTGAGRHGRGRKEGPVLSQQTLSPLGPAADRGMATLLSSQPNTLATPPPHHLQRQQHFTSQCQPQQQQFASQRQTLQQQQQQHASQQAVETAVPAGATPLDVLLPGLRPSRLVHSSQKADSSALQGLLPPPQPQSNAHLCNPPSGFVPGPSTSARKRPRDRPSLLALLSDSEDEDTGAPGSPLPAPAPSSQAQPQLQQSHQHQQPNLHHQHNQQQQQLHSQPPSQARAQPTSYPASQPRSQAHARTHFGSGTAHHHSRPGMWGASQNVEQGGVGVLRVMEAQRAQQRAVLSILPPAEPSPVSRLLGSAGALACGQDGEALLSSRVGTAAGMGAAGVGAGWVGGGLGRGGGKAAKGLGGRLKQLQGLVAGRQGELMEGWRLADVEHAAPSQHQTQPQPMLHLTVQSSSLEAGIAKCVCTCENRPGVFHVMLSNSHNLPDPEGRFTVHTPWHELRMPPSTLGHTLRHLSHTHTTGPSTAEPQAAGGADTQGPSAAANADAGGAADGNSGGGGGGVSSSHDVDSGGGHTHNTVLGCSSQPSSAAVQSSTYGSAGGGGGIGGSSGRPCSHMGSGQKRGEETRPVVVIALCVTPGHRPVGPVASAPAAGM